MYVNNEEEKKELRKPTLQMSIGDCCVFLLNNNVVERGSNERKKIQSKELSSHLGMVRAKDIWNAIASEIPSIPIGG